MYFLAAFLLLANLAVTGASLLTGRPKVDRHLQARDDWNPNNSTFVCMFMTSDPAWSGEMQNLCAVGGVCAAQLPDGLTANVSSAGPTEGQICFLYSDVNCTGTRSDPLVYPGNGDLSTIGFDKKAVSWRCWKMCGYVIGTSSSTSVSTVEPTIGPASSTSTTSDPPSSASSAAPSITHTSTSDVTVRALEVDATSTRPSITTTLTGSQPAVNISDTTQTSAPTAITSVNNTTFSSVSSTGGSTSSINASPTTFSLASSTTSSTTTVDTNTPGFSMSPSPVTLTHTFADGSTTVITTDVIEPVPTVPTVPPML